MTNMNLPVEDPPREPARKMSLKDRIKMFSKDGGQNDLARMAGSNHSPGKRNFKVPKQVNRSDLSPKKAPSSPPYSKPVRDEVDADDSTNGRRSSVASEASSGGTKSPKILRKKIEKVQILMDQAASNEGRASKTYKKLALKLDQYEAELDEAQEGVDQSMELSAPPPPPPTASPPTDDGVFLSPVPKGPRRTTSLPSGSSPNKAPKGPTTPRRTTSLRPTSEHGTSSSSEKSPTLLRKKIEKCHALLKYESRDSKAYQKLALKLEQYECELEVLEQEAPMSPPPKASANGGGLDTFLSPTTGRKDSLTKSEHSALSTGSGEKTPKILRKKIDKCQVLLQQETPNTRNHDRLKAKLEQYQQELEEIYAQEDDDTPMPNPMKTVEEHHEDEAQPKKSKGSLSSKSSLRRRPSKTGSPHKNPSKRMSDAHNPSANKANILLLKKKIEKVESMVIKEKDPKTFDRLTVKLAQYKEELEYLRQFPTSAPDSGDSATPGSPRRRSVGFDKGIKSPSRTNSTKNDDPAMVARKLRKVDKMMAELVKKQGQTAFTSSEFKKLVTKRDTYMSILKHDEGIKSGRLEKEQILREGEKRPHPNHTKSQVRRQRHRSKSFIAPIPLMVGNKPTTSAPTPAPAAAAAEATTPPPLLQATSTGTIGGPNKRKTGPKKKTEKVCATRIELDGKFRPKVFEKTEEDARIIRAELAQNFIFKKVPTASLEQMLKAFEPVHTYKKGDVIIQQGDAGDFFYIMGKGSVIFEVNEVNVGGTDKEGASFGELALLYRSPRKATVRANSADMLVYRVDQGTFRYILQSRSKFLALWKQAVNKIIAMNRLLGIGHVKATLGTTDEDESEHDKDGNESDGEASLNLEEAMDKDDDGFADDDSDADHELSMYMSELNNRRFSIQSSLSSVNVDSFRRNSILGEGQFGEVWLVSPLMDDIDDEVFALKIQSKEDMGRASADYSVAEAIERECKILSELCHPFIVDFVHHFEDEDNIYLVMGAIKGEELWNRIHQEQDDGEWVSGLSEPDSKFYALLIADTLHFMHRQQICYRDMKPENVMIDHTGYPVVVDFGFAKVVPDDKTYTFCGTPQYTAPEIIANQGHGRAVDNWALGIVIYEMITGENPFYYDGISDLKLLDDISNADPEPIKDDEVQCTDEVKDIIAKLLEKDPAKRLFGKEITSHPWFDSIDLNKARKMALPAPWAPQSDDDDE